MTFDREEMDTVVAVVDATISKLIRQTPLVQFQPGTVVNYEPQTGGIPAKASVQMDGDDAGDAISCPILLPHALTPGDRVMIVFSPPHQHYVIGILQSAGGCPAGSANEPVVASPVTDTNTPIPFEPYNEQSGMEWDPVLFGWVVPIQGIYSFSSTIENGEPPPCACPNVLVGTFTQSGVNFNGIRGFTISLDETILYTLETTGGGADEAVFRYTLPGLAPMDAGSPWKTQPADDPGSHTWVHLTGDASGNLSIIGSTLGFPATDRLLRITPAGTVSLILSELSEGWGDGSAPSRHAWSPIIGEFVSSGDEAGFGVDDSYWRLPDTGAASTAVYRSDSSTAGAPVVTSDGVWVYGAMVDGTPAYLGESSKLAAPIPKDKGDADTELFTAADVIVQDAWYCPDGTVRYLSMDTNVATGFTVAGYDPNTNTETDLSASCDVSASIPDANAIAPEYFVFQRGTSDVWVLHRDPGLFSFDYTLLST